MLYEAHLIRRLTRYTNMNVYVYTLNAEDDVEESVNEQVGLRVNPM